MSFAKGFLKLAADPIIFSNLAKSLGKGLKAGGESTVKDALKLKGLKHISDAAKESGGWHKAFTSQSGREKLTEAVGKAAPSIGVGAGYAAIGKKIYDKVSGGNDNSQQGYY